MLKVLVADNRKQDAERLRQILEGEGAQVEICLSGAVAEKWLSSGGESFNLAFILWDVAGPPSGLELLTKCRQVAPEMPVVVVGNYLDIDIAASAFPLGAHDLLLKPLDAKRVVGCIATLCTAQQPEAPLVVKLRETIIGESRALGETLRKVARVIPKKDSHVLLIGETGTGKELFAQAIHKLGPHPAEPLIAVHLRETAESLIESALFGHEPGAFTDAKERRIGYFELAGGGTLFLDEVGEFTRELQIKLLRVTQERRFRPLGATKEKLFRARLVCATNLDLAAAVNQGGFRSDLFYRLADVTIRVPPLREREGDVPILLHHFLNLQRGEQKVRLARETLEILQGYHFPGNVRELAKIISEALIECDSDQILPRHLNWQNMGMLHQSLRDNTAVNPAAVSGESLNADLIRLEEWLKLPYPEARRAVIRAFDRLYFPQKMKKHRYVTRAAEAAGVDPKTFRKHWDETELPPLSDKEE